MDYDDTAMKYIAMVEMATALEDQTPGIDFSDSLRKNLARNIDGFSKHSSIDHFDVMKKEDDFECKYRSINTKNNECEHFANIAKNEPTTEIPFNHHEQEDVERLTNSKLPRYHATNVIYNHFRESNVPLRSSTQQRNKGHSMWKRLVNRALDDKHFVYHIDGNKFSQIKSKDDPKISSYFQDSFAGEHTHLLLSKTKI